MVNTTDGAHKKHVPVIDVDGNTVTVKAGSADNLSLEVHYIKWILLETAGGMQMYWMKPEVNFRVNDRPVAAYEYCNLYGLWKTDIQ